MIGERMRGGCLCGEITYEVILPALDAGYCHCTICRRAAGAPVVAWGTVPKENFAFTKGTPRAFASSTKARRQFCGTCGSALTFQFADEPQTIDFTLATLANPEACAPQYHIWTESKLRWFDTADELPRHFGRGPDTWT